MFRKEKVILSSVKGQALIQALMLVFAVGAISSLIFSNLNSTASSSRLPRVKSQMLQIESKFRAGLLQMSNYQNCPSSGPYNNCSLQASYYSSFDTSVRGCKPSTAGSGNNNPAPGICGITITPGTRAFPAPGNVIYNAGSNTLDIYASINYSGSDVSVRSREILATIPLTSATSNIAFTGTCPTNAPVFQGFDSFGAPICVAVSPTCGPGEYLMQISQGQGTRPASECTSYAQNLNCPAGRYIASYSWNGGTNYTTTCENPADPFAYYNFSPNLAIGSAVNVGGTTTTSTTGPVTTTTTGSTTTTTNPATSCLTSNMGPICMEGTGVPYPSTCGAVGISPSSYPDCPINALMPYMPDPTAGMVDLSASNGRCRVPAYTSAGGSIDVCGGGCGTGFSGASINIPSGNSVEAVYQCGVSSGFTSTTTTTSPVTTTTTAPACVPSGTDITGSATSSCLPPDGGQCNYTESVCCSGSAKVISIIDGAGQVDPMTGALVPVYFNTFMCN